MKLTNRNEMSRWAYLQCKNGNDTKEMRNLITNGCWSFYYCKCIKDRKEMWKKIRNKNAFNYCQYIDHREEIKKNLGTIWSYYYCLHFWNDDVVWKNINRFPYTLLYYLNIEKKPEIKKFFKNKDKSTMDFYKNNHHKFYLINKGPGPVFYTSLPRMIN